MKTLIFIALIAGAGCWYYTQNRHPYLLHGKPEYVDQLTHRGWF